MLNSYLIKTCQNVKNIVVDKTEVEFGEINIYVHLLKGKCWYCPVCGNKCHVHQKAKEYRCWRGMDIGLVKTYLKAKIPRIYCPQHGCLVAMVPWARHNSRFTKDFESYVTWLAKMTTKKVVSMLCRISWNSIGSIIQRAVTDLTPSPKKRFANLQAIGVDETAKTKGHSYMTLVVNHQTSKVIWLHDGFGAKVFREFFFNLPREYHPNIKVVSGDGARWIDSVREEFIPEAVRVIDPYHVVAWVNEVLEKLRRQAYKDAYHQQRQAQATCQKLQLDGYTLAESLRLSKYALAKNPENLTKTQKAHLQSIATFDKRLYRAYKLKETLRLIFQMDFWSAKAQLEHWISWARRSRIEEFSELADKIARHKWHILAAIRFGISNSKVEGINNKIQTCIRSAYGFRNKDNLFAMIMLRCGDIQIQLPYS